ncbi:monofunctional peptidoglycan glycosyltransferase SgtB [Staphylococcus sp. SQ8-PEA]|uniref:Monofunctional glycosyltransferase n=1 Tax=Staphylococcus marylandisciuri TaxID=2981529 RepID=A0ABT2QQK2_9STAP|nr:monofunctional peptidoglycan glycosyltransferase SgtB [Staphylococcus marylandisciuri]MCU5746232.1 monofunctional peptidoglycan glycosyltransferase SgtB [Staphylococcus marylandisciuri]
MKRSDRLKPNHTAKSKQETPEYNTYYQPIGKPKRKKKGKGLILTVLLTLTLICCLFVGLMYYLSLSANVDDLKSIEDKHTYVAAKDMPEYTKGAFIAMEDERFYSHHGFDIKGMSRALFSTLGDHNVQGGSTITQQVVKNYYYDNERSFTRKVKELCVAHRVEKTYSKDEILSFYINNIYFGDDKYTIESAANHYFGTTTDVNNANLPKITVLQSAILASKINAPSVYNINDMSDNFKNRVKVNLEKMKQQNYISDNQYEEALQQLGVS